MFSDNLKTMRKAKGYTQEELAIKLKVVRQTVSKWEKGLSVTDADVLSKIADVLDTKVDILLGGTITDEDDKDAVAEQLYGDSFDDMIEDLYGIDIDDLFEN